MLFKLNVVSCMPKCVFKIVSVVHNVIVDCKNLFIRVKCTEWLYYYTHELGTG